MSGHESEFTPLPQQVKGEVKPQKHPVLTAYTKAILTTVLLLGLAGGASELAGNTHYLTALHGTDQVSDSEKQLRQAAYAAMAPLAMSTVADSDIPKAIAGMNLSEHDQKAMSDSLSAPTPSAQPTPTAPPKTIPAETPASSPAVAPAPKIRLVWLTLWDTVAEDGDVVSIQSGGYTRTVRLTKAPLTFAIPVSSNAVVNVTGISDGDGGGITVGLASGEAKAVFPIMSVGQTLGLHVAIN